MREQLAVPVFMTFAFIFIVVAIEYSLLAGVIGLIGTILLVTLYIKGGKR